MADANNNDASPPSNYDTDKIINLTVELPDDSLQIELKISTKELVQDIRQVIIDDSRALAYSCFHLEFNGKPLNELTELGEVEGLVSDSVLRLLPDPYTEKDARLHVLRISESIGTGTSQEKNDIYFGLAHGASSYERVKQGLDATSDTHSCAHDNLESYPFVESFQISPIIPRYVQEEPKALKSLSISPWNPPPLFLRSQGHLLYLLVTGLDGSECHITSHITGFWVNRSTSAKFDPTPKSGFPPSVHSLYVLLLEIDQKFAAAYKKRKEALSERDMLSLFPFTHAIPASPWLVSEEARSIAAHGPDITRTQDAFLNAGNEISDNMRDWNEEFQTIREMAATEVTEKLQRERATAKLFADFNEAAVRGAVLVARGELTPLNPNEPHDAHIFVYNNIFYSLGADGVGTFASEGGDAASRVATGKDLAGVRAVNNLDIADLYTAGTTIVDYMGKRVIAQSIVPGIFRQRDPGEPQIDYGAADGKGVIAEAEAFVEPFKLLASSFANKQHTVWDKEEKAHVLPTSVETKGLLGTDARKYVLDLYRITPPDIYWIETHWTSPEDKDDESEKRYPHRMSVMRPELIDACRVTKLEDYLATKRRKASGPEHESKQIEPGQPADSEDATPNGSDGDTSKLANGTEAEVEDKSKLSGLKEASDTDTNRGDAKLKDTNNVQSAMKAASNDEVEPNEKVEANVKPEASSDLKAEGDKSSTEGKDSSAKLVDSTEVRDQSLSAQKICESSRCADKQIEKKKLFEGFEFSFNPDVFSGQVAPTDEDRAQMTKDEEEVRKLGVHLRESVIPRMINDIRDGVASFPFDGRSLTALLHRRGINMRYLGLIATLVSHEQHERLKALRLLTIREMTTRAFKHVAIKYLRAVPPALALIVVAHLLNALFGYRLNPRPIAEFNPTIKEWYKDADFSFEDVTPESLAAEIAWEIQVRFAFAHPEASTGKLYKLKDSVVGLREICLRMGIQLVAREYHFERTSQETNGAETPLTNGHTANKKKKKKKTKDSPREESPSLVIPEQTFHSEDIIAFFPIIKDSAPKSKLAEDLVEAGHIDLMDGNRETGLDLLFDGLAMYEQMYGILHQDVAKQYMMLSNLFYQANEKDVSVELAHKGTVVTERAIGLDAADTIQAYQTLGLFEYNRGRAAQALPFMLHAFKLTKQTYGPDHPDSTTAVNNIAVVLQMLRRFHESRIWFEEALRLVQKFQGEENSLFATTLHQLAHAQALDNAPNEAVKTMRDAVAMYRKIMGPDHRMTADAQKLLGQLTTNAVTTAKYQRDVASGKIKVRTIPVKPLPLPGGNAQKSPLPAQDRRDIDELMKFIEGGDSKEKDSAKSSGSKSKLKKL